MAVRYHTLNIVANVSDSDSNISRQVKGSTASGNTAAGYRSWHVIIFTICDTAPPLT